MVCAPLFCGGEAVDRVGCRLRLRRRAWGALALALVLSAFLGCGAQPRYVQSFQGCPSPVWVVDQVDAGWALLVGPEPEDIRWISGRGLREGMVFADGRLSLVCEAQRRVALRGLRRRLEEDY